MNKEKFTGIALCYRCKLPATHKIAEDGVYDRHPFTTDMCCKCFGEAFGKVAQRWCSLNHNFDLLYKEKEYTEND